MFIKRTDRRVYWCISAGIVLSLALISAWFLVRTGVKNDAQALLYKEPVKEENGNKTFVLDTDNSHKDVHSRTTEIFKAFKTAASGSKTQDVDGQLSESLSKEAPSLEIVPSRNLRLTGIWLEIGNRARATILDLKTGRYGTYKVGDPIEGATIYKIDSDRVVLEKEGAFQVLRITDSGSMMNNPPMANSAVDGPAFTGGDEELLRFEPIEAENGPPADDSVHVKELPFFQPITNATGPPLDPQESYEDLPEFVPYSNDTGPE